MNKRITCITLFNKDSINRINSLLKKTNIKLCKVPYLENDRYSKDTLPYHITLHSWNKNQEEEALDIFKQIKISPIKLVVNSINIKESHNAYNLNLGIESNKDLINLYKIFYKETKNPKYNFETIKPHITIHYDVDLDKIICIKNSLEKGFKKFVIEFDKIGLYEIYPVKKIYN